MTTQHSPGPWKRGNAFNCCKGYAIRSGHFVIARVTGSWRRCDANASLIVRLANLYFAGEALGEKHDAEIRSKDGVPPDRAYGLSETENTAALMLNALMVERDELMVERRERFTSVAARWDSLAEGLKHAITSQHLEAFKKLNTRQRRPRK